MFCSLNLESWIFKFQWNLKLETHKNNYWWGKGRMIFYRTRNARYAIWEYYYFSLELHWFRNIRIAFSRQGFMWLTLGNNLTAFLSVFDVEISDGSNGPDALGEEMHFRVGKCISGSGGERGLWEGRKPTPCTRGRFYLPPGAFSRTKNHPETFYLKKLSNTTENHHFLSQIRLPSERLAILCVSRIAAVKLMLYGIILGWH